MRVYYSLIFFDGSNGTALLTISVPYSHLLNFLGVNLVSRSTAFKWLLSHLLVLLW